MKNVFGYDPKTNTLDGEIFVTKKIEGEIAKKREEFDNQAKIFERVAGMPKWFTLGTAIVWVAGLFLLALFFGIWEDITFAETMQKVGWAFIAGICCFVVGGGGMVFVAVKCKRAMSLPAYRALKEQEMRLFAESLEALGVPNDGAVIDVIATKSKPGKNYNERGAFTANANQPVVVFKRDESLGIFMCDRVLYIPFSRIERIQCINKRLWAQNWNKPEPFNKGRYRAFKILRNNNSGAIGAKPYYRLVVRDENYEEYVIIVPSYDAEFIVPLTGKTVE